MPPLPAHKIRSGGVHLPLLVAVLLFTKAFGQVTVLDEAVNPANNHHYYLLSASSWTEAEAKAVEIGGHLATINDSDESAWIWSVWGNRGSLWIGLSDAGQEGVFTWASGQTSLFSNWLPNEPNNIGNEDFVHMFGPAGKWNDTFNTYFESTFGVVEVEGEEIRAKIEIAAEISWFAESNKNYKVQYTTNLVSGSWTDLTGIIAGSHATNTVFDSTYQKPRRYYRIYRLP